MTRLTPRERLIMVAICLASALVYGAAIMAVWL